VRRLVLSAALTALSLQTDPQAIQRMVATERAFAAAAAEIGARDGFLTFFADDAIELTAGRDGPSATVNRAKEALRRLPSPALPLVTRLLWEPFTGQVSGDGTLGWLTGAYVSLNQVTHDITSHGAYFSVWRRQADGTWRVWLDEGISLPDVWQDASPFRAAPEPDVGTAGTPTETIEEAEHTLAGGGEAWRARLAADVRVHRDGHMPYVSRAAAATGATEAWQSFRYTLVTATVAGSGDLGVGLGGYDATTPTGLQHGTVVRIWKRDLTGRWRVVFETSKAAPN
jgi:ketosteroid isomerase-like protein